MKEILKSVVFAVVAGLVAGVVVLTFAPKQVTEVAVGSPAGATFSTAKVAAISWTLATGATSTSVLNTDSSDRYVTTLNLGCQNVGNSFTPLTGAGLASLQVRAATTSTNAPAVISNTALVGGAPLTVSTSSAQILIASSTASGPNGTQNLSFVWTAGSYMTFWSNATNTAQCVVGVNYLQS